MGATVAELRRRMTRSEFFSWFAFARVYPLVEAPIGPVQTATTFDGDPPADVPGLDIEIVQAFVSSSRQSRG